MKGVSIALETIIYIILAVMVLTVLLFFFTSQASPAQNRVELENKRAQLCGKYIQYDNRCDQISRAQSDPIGVDVATDLLSVCSKLDVRRCGAGGNDQDCIQYCCLECPTKPSEPRTT